MAVIRKISALALTLVLFMASTDPGVITSNLAKWWELGSGFPAPEWLQSRVADHVVQIACVVGIFVLVSAAFWRLRWFWRLRHKIKYAWRKLLANQVWISEDEAKRVMKDSTWGKLKEPTIRKSGGSILEFFTPTPGIVISGLSEAQKTELKFNAYVTMALNRFCESNPSATRVIEGKREIDEVLLKRHLDKAIETDLIKDFGDLPDFSAG